jgi:hypothetical protein
MKLAIFLSFVIVVFFLLVCSICTFIMYILNTSTCFYVLKVNISLHPCGPLPLFYKLLIKLSHKPKHKRDLVKVSEYLFLSLQTTRNK